MEISVTDSDEVLVARTASGATMLVERAEDALLDLQLLDDGLDDEVGLRQVGQSRSKRDPAEQLLLLVLGQLAALHRAGGRVLEVLAAALERLVGLLDADDGVAVAGEHLGDAGTHGAEADDADRGELPLTAGHAGHLPTGSVPGGCWIRHPREQVDCRPVRLVVARCQVDYAGRLTAHLPMATRLLMVKADGSVLVHSDGGSYKPLNWMSPPCTLREGTTDEGQVEWTVTSRPPARPEDTLRILLEEIHHDSQHELGIDPGLQKDGVEKHLQELLAEHPATLAAGLTLVRREYPTAIGPVDLMCRDADGASVAVEIKRRGEIDGVEQLTRYLELLNRDPLLRPVRGIFAAQEIKPQARVLAADRGITCATVDYDALRGLDDPTDRLF